MEHQHISKVLEWGFTAEHNFEASLWGCVLCDATSDKPFEYDDISIDHTQCDEDCFGCKAKGLQLATGDAGRDIPERKWQSRLNAYANAKAQGIQPGGTTPEKVQAAITASEALNRPYNAEKMPPAQKIDKRVATTMKEVGL